MQRINKTIRGIVETIHNEDMGLRTGFTQLDETIRGLSRGELHLVAGRPSMGKSALMLEMAMNLACTHKVAVFSLEMSTAMCIERMVANKMEVSLLYDLKSGKVQPDTDIVETIGNLDLSIEDKTLLSAEDMWSILERGDKFDVVFIDYLQLIKTKKEDSRYREIDTVCQNLRTIAKEKNCAVVLLCQLNREVDNRTDHRPRLSDLRESGGIEQICDKILFLHRPSYYAMYEEQKRKKEEIGDDSAAYIIVAKNRNGRLEDIPVVWKANCMRFEPCKFKLEEGF